MSIVLQVMGGWNGWWLIYIRVWVGQRGWVSSLTVFGGFFLCFCIFFCHVLSPLFRWLEHDGCYVCFFDFLFSSSLAPLIKSYWCIKMCLLCKTILKVRYLINILWISLEKGECFDFNHPLGFLLYSIHHHDTYRLSLSFQLADLLSLFVLPTCFDAGNPLEVKTPSS